MRQMFRYVLPVDDQWHDFKLTSMPFEVATTAFDHDKIEFWTEHSDEGVEVTWRLRVFATGQPLPDTAVWLGTTQRIGAEVGVSGGLVWHLYGDSSVTEGLAWLDEDDES